MSDEKDTTVPACNADECSVPSAAAKQTQFDAAAPPLELHVVSDVICPWCYVAKRHLEESLARLKADGKHLSVRWFPYELNPSMPKGGMDRKEYRSSKFGSLERSQALDAQVAAAGKGVGIEFRHDLMKRTPNTFAAHRLISFADREGSQDAVVEGLFKAYFTEGRDVGDQQVLSDVAAHAGLDRGLVQAFLHSNDGAEEVRNEIQMAQRAGLQGVPTFSLNGRVLFSGAQPASLMAATFRSLFPNG